MDTYISVTINPTDGTPYQQLINVNAVTAHNAGTLAGFPMVPRTTEYTWDISTTTLFPLATSNYVTTYLIRECINTSAVSGPVQVATPPRLFDITNIKIND